uniref:E2F-associated phosphoprotein n=1 Tax=Parascaris equorum TaxID=6256 RepID=A0A914R458_PAREQ
MYTEDRFWVYEIERYSLKKPDMGANERMCPVGGNSEHQSVREEELLLDCAWNAEKTKRIQRVLGQVDFQRNRMTDKAMKGKEEEMEFYDANEDDDNEQWVREHRRRLGLFNDETKGQKAGASFAAQEEEGDDTDAVLSCPACMTLLTRQCQRHQIYRNQYRSFFSIIIFAAQVIVKNA